MVQGFSKSSLVDPLAPSMFQGKRTAEQPAASVGRITSVVEDFEAAGAVELRQVGTISGW